MKNNENNMEKLIKMKIVMEKFLDFFQHRKNGKKKKKKKIGKMKNIHIFKKIEIC